MYINNHSAEIGLFNEMLLAIELMVTPKTDYIQSVKRNIEGAKSILTRVQGLPLHATYVDTRASLLDIFKKAGKIDLSHLNDSNIVCDEKLDAMNALASIMTIVGKRTLAAARRGHGRT